jgi:hypothetical protein
MQIEEDNTRDGYELKEGKEGKEAKAALAGAPVAIAAESWAQLKR